LLADKKCKGKLTKIGLYPRLSANRHLHPGQFGTPVKHEYKVISHLDGKGFGQPISHVVEYVTKWQ
jgi:hypothetical protein